MTNLVIDRIKQFTVDLNQANVEYELAIPSNVSNVTLRVSTRAVQQPVRYSWEKNVVDVSGDPYELLPVSTDRSLSGISGLTLYVASASAGVTIEGYMRD